MENIDVMDYYILMRAPMIVESSYALEIEAAEYNYMNIDTASGG